MQRGAFRRVLVPALMLALLATVPPAGAAAAEPITYRHQTQDLFPEDPEVDLALILSGTAYWRLDDAAVPAGGSATAALLPTPGPLDIDLQYRFRRACCAEQVVQGARSFNLDLPLGAVTLDDLEVGDRLARLRVEGRLTAVASAEGPGTVVAPSRPWTAWESQPLGVSAKAGARQGEEVVVQLQTRYEWRVELHLDDGQAVRRVQEGPAVAQGDAAMERAFPIGAVAAARAAQNVPGPELALVVAVLAGAALTRSRQGP